MTRSRLATVALGVFALGCVHLRPPPPVSSVNAAAAWGPVITAAHRDASAGRSEDAERVLRDFSAAYPGTVEAAESDYWRAVFMLDPSNPRSSPRDAATLLGEYLDSNVLGAHRPEAAVLRRIATTLASAREAATAALAARATAPDPRDGEVRRLDAEVKRLKEELEKTTAELDRIKKRLTTPPSGTPPPAGTPPAGTPPPATPPPPIRPPG